MNRMMSPNVPAMMTAAYIGDREVVVEYFVPCGGYYQLADIIRKIEHYLKNKVQVERNMVTALVYGKWPSDQALAQIAQAS
jgi:hypothetical protein